jgi:hypothetical protein
MLDHFITVPRSAYRKYSAFDLTPEATSAVINTVSEDAKAAMQKLETALNETYVTPRQPVPGTKGIM